MSARSQLYIFTLGREWKLSLAELLSVFGRETYHFHTESLAILALEAYSDESLKQIFSSLGGSVRVMSIQSPTTEVSFASDVLSVLINKQGSGKVTFGLGSYGAELPLATLGLRMKKTLGEKGIPSRIINTDNKNLSSAAFKKEKLGKSGQEYSYLRIPEFGEYLGVTLACQDIDRYSRRDMEKQRDMEVGMLPPKLAQVMINLSKEKFKGKIFGSFGEDKGTIDNTRGIYDPFCGLGTVLIEAANMGNTRIMGSDISKTMVKASSDSLEAFIREEKVWQERIIVAGGKPRKDFSNFGSHIFELDATTILSYFHREDTKQEDIFLEHFAIVSEGYLGEIMQKDSITLERVKQERLKLAAMYDSFFGGLKRLQYEGTIVMTFPFWDMRGSLSFFTEIYEILARHGYTTLPLLPEKLEHLLTRKGTLLYKRPGQNVGREVWRGKLISP